MQFSLQHILKRRELIARIERNDVNRFKPNPLGPGFLTRQERYGELWRTMHRRLANAKLEPRWGRQ